MFLYRIEIKLRGEILKVVAARAVDALKAIDGVARSYPAGPYEFVARRMSVAR